MQNEEWWNTCPYRNEERSCHHCEITRKLVQEATRRGELKARKHIMEVVEFRKKMGVVSMSKDFQEGYERCCEHLLAILSNSQE